jgi:transposase
VIALLQPIATPMLFAPSLQDWLAPDHLARFIVESVERLDLRAIENSYAGRGELAYRPKVLVALLVYGYATGTFSSRKIERPCVDSIAFRYIAANTSPDHDTIANFRKRILPMLPSIFLQVLLIARESGFLTLGQISLDASKIKANASKHHAYSYKHAGKIKAKLRREIARPLRLAAKADNEPLPDLDIPAEIARRENLIARIDQARAKIEAREAERHDAVRAQHAQRLAQRREEQRTTGKKPKGPRPKAAKLRVELTAQINLTDEESRIMPTADGFIQGYNAQAAVSMGRKSKTEPTNRPKRARLAVTAVTTDARASSSSARFSAEQAASVRIPRPRPHAAGPGPCRASFRAVPGPRRCPAVRPASRKSAATSWSLTRAFRGIVAIRFASNFSYAIGVSRFVVDGRSWRWHGGASWSSWRADPRRAWQWRTRRQLRGRRGVPATSFHWFSRAFGRDSAVSVP